MLPVKPKIVKLKCACICKPYCIIFISNLILPYTNIDRIKKKLFIQLTLFIKDALQNYEINRQNSVYEFLQGFHILHKYSN